MSRRQDDSASLFVLYGAEHAERGVAAAGVVPGFDVLEDRLGQFLTRCPVLPIEQFELAAAALLAQELALVLPAGVTGAGRDVGGARKREDRSGGDGHRAASAARLDHHMETTVSSIRDLVTESAWSQLWSHYGR